MSKAAIHMFQVAVKSVRVRHAGDRNEVERIGKVSMKFWRAVVNKTGITLPHFADYYSRGCCLGQVATPQYLALV
jgi:hypothetical protein